MRNRAGEIAALRPGAYTGLAGAPASARAMLAFDTSLAWAALLLLAIGLVMV